MMSFLEKLVPAITWIKTYKKEWFKGDVMAGITVGVMLIPQGMAYAMIAGLPPIYGLYASTVPLIIYAFLGTSRQLAVGPVAMVSLLTAAGIGMFAEAGSEQFIAMAIVLALMVGTFQLLMGVFRLGFLVNFLSHPIISGFTSAAAIIIGLSQLKHLLGISIQRTHHIHEIIIESFRQTSQINWVTFFIGFLGIAIIVLIRRWKKSFPSQLIVVVIGILVVWLGSLTAFEVKIVGTIPGGLPSLSFPEISSKNLLDLLPIAFTISIIAFMESIAVAKAIQAKHRDYEIDSNKELIGLGFSNILGSLFHSFPVTGGFSRTAVNHQAGAKTGLASLISALLIILTLLFLTPLFYYLPNAILAAVIMVAVFGLIDFKEVKYLWKANKTDFYLLIVTFFSTLALGIEQGIAIGVLLSLIMVIYRTTQPHIAVLGRIPGTEIYRNVDRFKQLHQSKEVLVIRFDAELYFANVQYFKDNLNRFINEKGSSLRLIVINAMSMNDIDSTGVHSLVEMIKELNETGIHVSFAEVKGPVRDALVKGGMDQWIDESNFFLTVHQAVKAFNDPGFRDQMKEFDVFVQQNNSNE